jgi:membrane protein
MEQHVQTPARPRANADADAPAGPTKLRKRAWRDVLSRTVSEFKDDNLTVWAAALTYYGILSIFPAILALVSILGLIGTSAIQPLLDNLGQVAPGPAKDILTSALQNLQHRGSAGIMFFVGIVLALWSASGYVAGFMQASNAIYDMEEGRPIWKTIPTRLGVTLVVVLLLALSAVAVVLTGSLATHAGKIIGVGSAAVMVWDIAKWPVLLLMIAAIFAVLYYMSPNVKHAGVRWVTPGGVLAVIVWIAASALFALYVANFSSYNKTYGALAGPIVFLIWLYVSNIAVLLGAEFNAELERGRRIEAGHPADVEPFAEPRDTRAFSD